MEMDKIFDELQQINKKLDILIESNHKMNNHISFVQDVYEYVRKPLSFIIRKPKELPSIPKQDNNEF
jgi:hypothetical protein